MAFLTTLSWTRAIPELYPAHDAPGSRIGTLRPSTAFTQSLAPLLRKRNRLYSLRPLPRAAEANEGLGATFSFFNTLCLERRRNSGFALRTSHFDTFVQLARAKFSGLIVSWRKDLSASFRIKRFGPVLLSVNWAHSSRLSLNCSGRARHGTRLMIGWMSSSRGKYVQLTAIACGGRLQSLRRFDWRSASMARRGKSSRVTNRYKGIDNTFVQ